MKQGKSNNGNSKNLFHKDNLLSIDLKSFDPATSIIDSFDLKSFLGQYSGKDAIRLGKLSPKGYILLSEQLKLYPKAALKLPKFTSKFCWFTTKSYEQSSSELLAEYKAGLFSGETVIDLTGGLGVDDWAFSRSFKKVISVDIDPELNRLVKINFKKLGLNNVERITADSEEFINRSFSSQLVYIDCDRRVKGKRAVTLEDSSPAVLTMLPRLWEVTENILLKLSPLIDITYLIKRLPAIEKIIVVSAGNEVKEILISMNKNFKGEITIKAVDLSHHIREYSGNYSTGSLPTISSGGKYFYEPSGSLIKSGLVNSYAHEKGLSTISKNGIFLTSSNLIENFFGRSFKIISQMKFAKSVVKKYLTENKISKANVSRRDFPLDVAELRKLFKIKDGGDDFLFFTQSDDKEKLFFHCRKL